MDIYLRRKTRKNPYLKGLSKMSPNSSSTGRTSVDNTAEGCEFESHLLVKLIKMQ